MRIMVMAIGLPRSGKSTKVMDYTDEGYVKVSADDFRSLMYGQRFYAEGEGMMWATRDIALKILLQQSVDVVIDETNTTALTRKKLFRLAERYGYTVHGVFMDTDITECIRRAIHSDQRDLIPTIEKLNNSLEEPLIGEGFKSLIRYKNGHRSIEWDNKPLQDREEELDEGKAPKEEPTTYRANVGSDGMPYVARIDIRAKESSEDMPYIHLHHNQKHED